MVLVSFILRLHLVKMTNRVGRKYNLPFVQFVDGKGNMAEKLHMQVYLLKKADPDGSERSGQRGQAVLTHRSLSMIIPIAGDVIHR